RFREEIFRLPTVGVPFDPVTAEHLVLPHLLKSLKETLNLVMVLELNVARVQGALKGETPEERCHNFCERLRQMDVQLSIAREYPVLFRSLHMITMNWVHYSLELLDRLSKDWTVIRRNLVGAAEAGSLTSILLGVAAPRRGGGTVPLLTSPPRFNLGYNQQSRSVEFLLADSPTVPNT